MSPLSDLDAVVPDPEYDTRAAWIIEASRSTAGIVSTNLTKPPLFICYSVSLLSNLFLAT